MCACCLLAAYAKGEEADDEAEDELADRSGRLEEDGQADDRQLARALDQLSVS